MGVVFEPRAFAGPYTLFARFRRALARCIGIHLPAMRGYELDDLGWRAKHWRALAAGEPIPDQEPGIAWENLPPDPLHDLLLMPDNEGRLDWRRCGPLADRIEQILDRIEPLQENLQYGTWRDLAQTFANGCRAAYESKEDLTWG